MSVRQFRNHLNDWSLEKCKGNAADKFFAAIHWLIWTFYKDNVISSTVNWYNFFVELDIQSFTERLNKISIGSLRQKIPTFIHSIFIVVDWKLLGRRGFIMLSEINKSLCASTFLIWHMGTFLKQKLFGSPMNRDIMIKFSWISFSCFEKFENIILSSF